MKLLRHTGRGAAVPAAAALALLFGSAALAEPLTFSGTPASDAIAQIDQKYGVQLVLRGNLNPSQAVSFSEGSGPGARLVTINNLANALGADFQKVYVLSHAAGDVASSVPVDTNADVVFPSATIPAAEAIQRVASVDNATVRLPANLTGNVTLSATTLSAADAAAEIARQTHTRWKAFYALTPRRQGRNLAGKVIDRTRGGSPILQEPYTTFQRPAPPETATAQNGQNPQNGQGTADNGQQANAGDQQGAATGQQGTGQNGQTAAGQYNQALNGANNPYAYNYGPYAYNYSPFGYSPMYPVSPGAAFTPDPYYVYQTGPAYDYGVPYMNTYGGFSPGGFSFGNGAVNVLPGYGGPAFSPPIVVGGGNTFGF